jgi:hypothetical protein
MVTFALLFLFLLVHLMPFCSYFYSFLSIFKSNRTKIGYAIQLMFKLTQNKRDKELLELVAKFMNCGAVYSHGENAFDLTVSKLADNQNIIIPMFKTYPIQGIKSWNIKISVKLLL